MTIYHVYCIDRTTEENATVDDYIEIDLGHYLHKADAEKCKAFHDEVIRKHARGNLSSAMIKEILVIESR
jgi:hypothetical protein